MTIIVTGAAGFIGFHVSAALLDRGEMVAGIDNLNDYYSVALKKARLDRLSSRKGFSFFEVDVGDPSEVDAAFAAAGPVTGIIHLAAQAGVRYSMQNPQAYGHANIIGQIAILEVALRCEGLRHLVYASSSSVYGANTKLPFSVDDPVERPISLYAATKRADELITYSYCHTRGLTATGLRFFTVYGPWGRPDMAAYLFTDAIMAGRPIRVFNHGSMRRDFTYISDIVTGVLAAFDRPAAPDAEGIRHALYNLGNHRAESLMDFIGVIAAELGREPVFDMQPMQPGDVPATYADIAASRRDLGFEPKVTIREGIPRFVAWYRDYHGVD